MRRIRLALLAVAIGLAVPIALLAWRALEGLALERAVRHQALAERVFDEMERSLSVWLESEEARPFEHYRFYVSEPEERSPLAEAPAEPFVVGAFQIDPDGSVHTPMQPRDEKAARKRGHWPPPDALARAIDQVTQVVRETWREELSAGGALRQSELREPKDAPAVEKPEKTARIGDKRDAKSLGERQDPGTTRPVGGVLAGKLQAAKKETDDAAQTENVYEALQRFNRGADRRAQRKQKIAVAKLPPRADADAASSGFADSFEESEAAAEVMLARRSDAQRTPSSVAPGASSLEGTVELESNLAKGSSPAPAEARPKAEAAPSQQKRAESRSVLGSIAQVFRGSGQAMSGAAVPAEPSAVPRPSASPAAPPRSSPSSPPALGDEVTGEGAGEPLQEAGRLSDVPPPSQPARRLRIASPQSREAPSVAEEVAVQRLAARVRQLDAEEDAAPQDEALRLALDPMVGRTAGDDRLLLVRTVLVGTRGYRQGLVLDRERLGRWLEQRALAPSGLSRVARVSFDGRGVASDDADFVFEHRFAEPFDAVTAQLSLRALAGVGYPGAIYALVALLGVVGAAGLLAIHRMVAVAVHFAERRSNFVSAVTHELKTPLTAIRMYAEMLRDGLVPDERKKGEYYGTITDESERLSRLIDNVLEFSRLERGAREMNWSVGPVGPVLREAADKLRTHAEHGGFQLDLEIEPELPPVRYDRDALLQVLFNLVDNAMKYARGADTKRVVLEARRSADGVELSVRDFGPGVSGRHLSRIFEPFYRGEDELTRSAKGTGIGLALVRDLSERMGAAVRGGNDPEGGFRVCLAFEAVRPA